MQAPNFDRGYTIARDGQLTLTEAFALAANIECCDDEWNLRCDADSALAAMFVLEDGIYEVMREDHEKWFARLGAYNRIREALEAIFPDAHASVTDPWEFECYSDLYKDDHGFRPRGHITGPDMRAWIKRRAARYRNGESPWDDEAYAA